ncbi:MAG: hypothetical protein AB7U61_12570 [Methylocystis sp.]
MTKRGRIPAARRRRRNSAAKFTLMARCPLLSFIEMESRTPAPPLLA